VDGEILKLDVRSGEYASASITPEPLLLLGALEPLHLRVDVDEQEAWRVNPTATAVAAVRGNPAQQTPLEFVRFEPYVVPKRSLTGASDERVDTRASCKSSTASNPTASLSTSASKWTFSSKRRRSRKSRRRIRSAREE
jgi:hypothetical protein